MTQKKTSKKRKRKSKQIDRPAGRTAHPSACLNTTPEAHPFVEPGKGVIFLSVKPNPGSVPTAKNAYAIH